MNNIIVPVHRTCRLPTGSSCAEPQKKGVTQVFAIIPAYQKIKRH